MSVGVALTKAGIDSRAGDLAWQVMNWLTRCHDYHERLDTIPDATLEGLGYTSGEIAILKSAFGDLDLLWQVLHGQAEVTPAKDFTAFAGQLTADLV